MPANTTSEIDTELADWSIPNWEREKPTRFWDPGRKLLRTVRQYQALKDSNSPFNSLKAKLIVARHKFWSTVAGAEIGLSCQIGGGLLLPHPNGIVIHPECIIGPNCLIFQQVTLAGIVTLGYHVDIGAGAKVMGPLSIQDNVRVGANAVVTRDVEEGDTVAGIPAISIRKK